MKSNERKKNVQNILSQTASNDLSDLFTIAWLYLYVFCLFVGVGMCVYVYLCENVLIMYGKEFGW